MATGEIRAAFSLSEPELGSDVAAIKTTGTKTDDGDWEINGQKMWVTNGLRSGLVFVLVRTDRDSETPQKGMTCFICEKEPGAAENPGPARSRRRSRSSATRASSRPSWSSTATAARPNMVLGGEEAGLNKGFPQMMDALEVGRVNVAARGVGIAQRALELALRYSQERKAFGKPIAQHQAIQFKLADMATQGRGGAAADAQGGADEGRRRALGPRGRHGEAVRLRGRQGARRGVASASTAATATRRSTRSSASTATRRCC